MAEQECTTFRDVTVNFGQSTEPLKNGYIIRYRKVGSKDPYKQVRVTSLPFTIEDAPACYGLEISVQADCGVFGVGTAVIASTEFFVRLTGISEQESVPHTCADGTIYRTGCDRVRYVADFFQDPLGKIPRPVYDLDLNVNVAGVDKRIRCNGRSVDVGFSSTCYTKQENACKSDVKVTGDMVFITPGSNYQLIE